MEWIVERNNMRRALEQVRRNKGAPGADAMTVDALASHLKKHWPAIRAQLLDGTYQPQPVRRVEIPKERIEPRLFAGKRFPHHHR
jgi:RNA-directed DNA polymerase